MSALSLSMLCTVSAPICSVFCSIVNRIVMKNSIEELPLLYYIFNQSIVTRIAFKRLTQSMHSSVEIIYCLIKYRILLDKIIDSTVKIIEKSGLEHISCNDLENLFVKNNNPISLYEKHYIFTLLTEHHKKDTLEQRCHPVYNCNETFPVNNILANYTPIDTIIDDAICESARLADHLMLKHIIVAASDNDLKCSFNPEANPVHKEIISWLQENIVKGCNGDTRLGWQAGADSAKWPSTDFKDYIKTLDRLHKIMS